MGLDAVLQELDPRNDLQRITPYLAPEVRNFLPWMGYTVLGLGKSIVRGATVGTLIGLAISPFTDEPLRADIALYGALTAVADIMQYHLRATRSRLMRPRNDASE